MRAKLQAAIIYIRVYILFFNFHPALLLSVIEYHGLSALLDSRFSFLNTRRKERERENFSLDKITAY